MSNEPKTKIGVMVGIPVRYHHTGDKFHPNLRALLNNLGKLSLDPLCPYEFTWAVCAGGLVRARNRIVAEFLKTSGKFFIFLDDDIDATSDDLLALLAHKKPIVAALYTTREEHKPHWVCTFLHEVELQKNGLLQVLEVGTGLKCYHRQVFEELIRLFPAIGYPDRDSGEKGYGFFQHCVVEGDLMPGDYFCDYLCRKVHIAIWVDTNLKRKHRGPDGTLYPVGGWPPIPGV